MAADCIMYYVFFLLIYPTYKFLNVTSVYCVQFVVIL